MERKYNFIIFGATGLTGKYLIEEMLKASVQDKQPTNTKFAWAIAGRSVSKLNTELQQVLEDMSLKGQSIPKIDTIVADVSDEESLKSMVKQCDVVLNCVGPFLLYGEAVVKACVQQGTHHIDISDEPLFFKNIYSKYNEAARVSGSYIITSCGFASIPADYGSAFLSKKFEGTINSMESYIETVTRLDTIRLTYGTWSSLILTHNKELEVNSCIPERRTESHEYLYKLDNRIIKYCPEVQSWCTRIPFPLNNDQVTMDHSQRDNYSQNGRKPAQTQAFIQMPNFFVTVLLAFALIMFKYVTTFRFGRYLLLKFPKIATLGKVTEKAPTTEELDGEYKFHVVIKGWNKNAAKTDGNFATPPNKTSLLTVSFKNGYKATAKMMLEAGKSILLERTLLPQRGGIYTPGFAFGDTSLAERLNKVGVVFTLNDDKVVKQNELKKLE